MYPNTGVRDYKVLQAQIKGPVMFNQKPREQNCWWTSSVIRTQHMPTINLILIALYTETDTSHLIHSDGGIKDM